MLSMKFSFIVLFLIMILSIVSSSIFRLFVISFSMFLVVFVFVFFNLSSMSAIATSGAVDEFVRVRDEFPFIVNDPIVFVFIL